MHFTAQTTGHGVVERSFAAAGIPGMLWSPDTDESTAPLILLGHGGGLHKTSPDVVRRARHYVTTCGFRAAAIDAPGHGDRPREERDRRWVASMLEARDAGEPIGPVVAEFNSSLAERAVPEWRAVIDALQGLPEIGTETPLGYGGMTLGSTIGISLAAVEPRIGAAVFGGVMVYDSLVDAASTITIPIQYLLPWQDPELDRQAELDLFDAFGSADKTLHATVGSHFQVPWFETEDSARFYARQLARPEASQSTDRPGLRV